MHKNFSKQFYLLNFLAIKTISVLYLTFTGLTLIINIGIYEYVKFLTEEAGIKVVIHDQKAMPFPDHDSLSTSPGQVNNIAVKMVSLW